MVVQCNVEANSRKKLFWATQPDACGTTEHCGDECGQAGLSLVRVTGGTTGDCPMDECDPTYDPDCPVVDTVTTETSATIATSDWVRGLALNMLMTDARKADTACGLRPGSQGGHWSESYTSEGSGSIGTLMRYVPTSGSILESMRLVTAYAQSTLDRLVDRGVATSVEVTSSYLGGAKMQLDIVVYGISQVESRVSVAGSRLENSWVWS